MYNLIVSGEEGVWDGRRYILAFDRFAEYTPEAFRAKYRSLDDQAVEELTSFPTLFLYERFHALPARVGRVTRLTRSTQGIRFEFELIDAVPPIPATQIPDIAWDLDIADWEFQRTHWAVKDVDLLEVLRDFDLLPSVDVLTQFSGSTVHPRQSAPTSLLITPSVFSVPSVPQDKDQVAVMMPFAAEFNAVYEAISRACANAGLRCQRADDIWEESTIIQDVFNLLFRSAVVVVDLTGQNSNVLYETGIAHTLGRPVVPISQPAGRLPFDLAHHRILTYLPNDQGLGEMTTRLEQRLHRLTEITPGSP